MLWAKVILDMLKKGNLEHCLLEMSKHYTSWIFKGVLKTLTPKLRISSEYLVLKSFLYVMTAWILVTARNELGMRKYY